MAPSNSSALIAAFEVDVTPPLGSPLFASVRAVRIRDPLGLRGIVVVAESDRFVLASLDWCELRNESYGLWRQALAEAAGTVPEQILLSCVHQHDAPRSDRGGQTMLDAHGLAGSLQDMGFEDEVLGRAKATIAGALDNLVPFTAVGFGRAQATRVASNRRWRDASGAIRFDRNSTTRDPLGRSQTAGTVDRTVSAVTLWSKGRRLAVLHHFATHPMTRYGFGEVSADFVGDARRALAQQDPEPTHIYLSGCSGDVTVGKFNNGNLANRSALAARLASAMASAAERSSEQRPASVQFRLAKIGLRARTGEAFDVSHLQAILTDPSLPENERVDAALRLHWVARASAGVALDLPCLSLGDVDLLVFPAETFVQYQLWVKALAPRRHVLAIGNGDGAPGYLPTREALGEGYEDPYCWVATDDLEDSILGAAREALGVGS